MTNISNSTDAACILDLSAWLQAEYGDPTFPLLYAETIYDHNPSFGLSLIYAWVIDQHPFEVRGFLAGWDYAHRSLNSCKTESADPSETHPYKPGFDDICVTCDRAYETGRH